ncbi:MAG: N-6 DNA methylase, partial [bacterium]|nr:N-6 DNA methylase [Candidatus Minthenecus merdequi]
DRFPDGEYVDVVGLCKAATLDDIKEQDYSLNPGRYVGVVIEDDGMTEEEFFETMDSLNAEFSALNVEAAELARQIETNLNELRRK